MDNLVDLLEAISMSSLDDEVKEMLKKAVAVEAQEKPISVLEKVVDDFIEGKDS